MTKVAALERSRARSLSTPNERTRARLARAVRRREALVELLSPDLTCAECGDQFQHPSQLQVDHVDGITWNRRAVSPQMRAARYWREHQSGVPLRALCGMCNATDGGYRRAEQRRRG